MKLFFIPSKDLFNLFENKKNLEDAADVSFKLPIKGVRHVVLSADDISCLWSYHDKFLQCLSFTTKSNIINNTLYNT